MLNVASVNCSSCFREKKNEISTTTDHQPQRKWHVCLSLEDQTTVVCTTIQLLTNHYGRRSARSPAARFPDDLVPLLFLLLFAFFGFSRSPRRCRTASMFLSTTCVAPRRHPKVKWRRQRKATVQTRENQRLGSEREDARVDRNPHSQKDKREKKQKPSGFTGEHG